MPEAELKRISIIGFGELGHHLTQGLSEQGVEVTVYCDGPRNHVPYSDPFRRRVSDAGGKLVNSAAEAVRGAQMVWSVVVPGETVKIAREAASSIDKGGLFVDVNSVAPRLKKEAAAFVEAAGGGYVDAAYMSNPRADGMAMPFIVSGSGAAEFKQLVSPLGPRIDLAGTEAGTASMIKTLRSLVAKGVAALAWELFFAARKAGLVEEAYQYALKVDDRKQYSDMFVNQLGRTAQHSKRRADEMENVITTLSDIGCSTDMTEGTHRVLSKLSNLPLSSALTPEVMKNWREVILTVDSIAEITEDG